MSSETRTEAGGRAMLHLPDQFPVPDEDTVVQDARAILLHSLSLRREVEPTGVLISPVWENLGGQAHVRAAIVPAQVASRFFVGPGIVTLRDASVMEMVASIVVMLLEDPMNAAVVLEPTEQLWVSKDAPVRSLGVPYKPYFKLLTLVLADFCRKVGAGFTELEWIASLGLLEAFHDPSTDKPRDKVLASMRTKSAAMCEAEADWMRALVAQP